MPIYYYSSEILRKKEKNEGSKTSKDDNTRANYFSYTKYFRLKQKQRKLFKEIAKHETIGAIEETRKFLCQERTSSHVLIEIIELII